MRTITFKQVSKSRPNYYRLFIDGKEVCEFRHPARNPFLSGKSLAELANHEANRIINA
jgi:hypothetical protein